MAKWVFFRGGMVLCLVLLAVTSYGEGEAAMTNSWAVEIQSGGEIAAAALASKYGFVNLGQV